MIININLIYVSPCYYTTVVKVIDTLVQSPDINPIENLWVYLKKKVGKTQPTNKIEFIKFIKVEWEKIPVEYDEAYSIHVKASAIDGN